MSLILEALKKSEAERRRGQSPDLFGAALGTAPPRREIPRVWPLLLLGLILLASAWMIWSGGSRGEPLAPAQTPPAETEAPAEARVASAPSRPPVALPAAPRPAPVAPAPKPGAKPALQEAPALPSAFVPAPSPESEPSPPPEEALPTLSALDAGSRAALPPLKRFAIIDGQRIGEGALLAGGVVESIRRDGVVINVNGRRLLLPKP